LCDRVGCFRSEWRSFDIHTKQLVVVEILVAVNSVHQIDDGQNEGSLRLT
jgi:hypothetical protein